ncbi:MAG: hypothetical protein GY715_10655 [Planctomycetes bacterium]|nr:hypothetical protein [Planctomycetota bacterium]
MKPILSSTLSILAIAAPAWGHNALCEHDHELGDDVITCQDLHVECDDDENTCEHAQSTRRGWCACGDEGKPTLHLLGYAAFDPGAAGGPDAGEVITYSTVDDPRNIWDLVTNAVAVVTELGPGGHDLAGTLTLSYGDFTDPLAVPVEIIDLDLVLPGGVVGGQPTGPLVITLPIDVPLTYAVPLGVIDTLGPEGFEVIVDTNLWTGQPARLNIECRFDPDGRLLALVQGIQLIPCTGDLDGDGDVDFGDILSVIGAWGPCLACPQDLNGNGHVDFADVLAVIGAWGPCP